MEIDVLTLFPHMFDGFLAETTVKIAREKGILDVRLFDIREFSSDRHHCVDDKPFGGGPGMVMMCQPVVDCIEKVTGLREGKPSILVLSPQGRRLDQRYVAELAGREWLVLVCGRYEGFDERIFELVETEEISIGDFVLAGGEVAAMAVIEAVTRLLPGVVGDPASLVEESFETGLLDYPQYTRPRVFNGLAVPEVLLSGDHARIEKWRRRQALARTTSRRKDLLERKRSKNDEHTGQGC